MIGVFCRMQSLLQGSFAKETYNLEERTNRSHPISDMFVGRAKIQKGYVVSECLCNDSTFGGKYVRGDMYIPKRDVKKKPIGYLDTFVGAM